MMQCRHPQAQNTEQCSMPRRRPWRPCQARHMLVKPAARLLGDERAAKHLLGQLQSFGLLHNVHAALRHDHARHTQGQGHASA